MRKSTANAEKRGAKRNDSGPNVFSAIFASLRFQLAGAQPGLVNCAIRLPGFVVLWVFALGVVSSLGTPTAPVENQALPPSTPRDFYNAGTQKLREGKLREAEAFLENVLASQRESLQPPALYNLGHVRFRQGVEELKKGPAAGATARRSQEATEGAEDAIKAADDALAGDEVRSMVEAYLRGRGMRKELKSVIKAVKQAMETHGTALAKWQRASGDFKSTVELNPADTEARQNAEAVDRRIAKLIDSIRELQQAAAAMGQKGQELGDKLKQLKGRIPAPNMPPGAPGDDEEDEDQPKGPEPGQKEAPSKEGREINPSPEEAGWLLDSFKLDTERRLPMGTKDTADPKAPSRRTW
jgi:tetratricopeptide (TPR) repeat protein